MPFRYEWDAKNNVLVNFYSGEITQDEIRQTYLDAEPYFDNSTGLVHNILHLTHSSFDHTIKTDKLFNIPEVANYANKYRERIGWSLYVGHKDNALYQMVSAINMQKSNLRMRWFNTMDEAYQFLHDNGMIESPDNPYA